MYNGRAELQQEKVSRRRVCHKHSNQGVPLIQLGHHKKVVKLHFKVQE